MTEAQFLANVRELAATLHLKVYHTYRSTRSEPGFPDVVLVGPGGCLFRELKTATGRLTPAQVEWIAALRGAGQDADVWRPEDLTSGRISQELSAIKRRQAVTA